MRALRLFAASTVFMVVVNVNCFGYKVLCQSTAKAVTAGESLVTLVSCAIPGNSVGVGKSIRVTASFHPSSGDNMTIDLYYNGNDSNLFSVSAAPNVEQTWSFILVNDGNSGWDIGGTQIVGETTLAIGPHTSSPEFSGPIPWSTGWTLAFEVSYPCGCTNTFQAVADTFVVEILD